MRNWFSIRRTPETSAESDTAPANWPSRRAGILHIFVLFSFAVAQPVYDHLGGHAAFLANQQIGLFAILTVVFSLSLVLPAVLVALEAIVGRFGKRYHSICHLATVFVLLLLLLLPVVNRLTFLPGYVTACEAIVLSALGVWCYHRFQAARTLVSFASPGILLFPALFLWQMPLWGNSSSVTSRRQPDFKLVPVVVLVLDEFCGASLMTPEREIDAHRFPNFAALGSQSTWFRNATSVNPDTEQAVPAILTGCYPSTPHPPMATDVPQNLFSVLHDAGGYELAAFEPVSSLSPRLRGSSSDSSYGLISQTSTLVNALWRVYLFHITPADYQRHLPTIPRTWFGLSEMAQIDRTQTRGVFRYPWGAKRDAQFQHFLDTFDELDQPALHFMHILLPHLPWSFLPSGRRHSEDGDDWRLLEMGSSDDVPGKWSNDELEVIHGQQRYLLQIMYLDRLLGQLIARLKETGQYDRSLLIVTADHGISFRPGVARRGLMSENQDEILSIPLFIKRPGQTTGAISDQPVESVDILPTVADVVGLSLESPIDGWSMFDESHPTRHEKSVQNPAWRKTVDPTVIVDSESPRTLRKRFGNSADSEAIYRIGPIPDLIGRDLQSLVGSNKATVDIEFTRFGDRVEDSPETEIPCYFEGTVRSPLIDQKPIVLAVAVNGKIRAVTRTYQLQNFRDRWTAFVPESAFHLGQNDVKFFSVEGTAPDWQLSPCVSGQK